MVPIYSDKTKKQAITSFNDWYKYCPPAGKKKQWVPQRSAKELARFWLSEEWQQDFIEYLSNNFPDIEIMEAIPEYKTAFDQFKSPRQNDLCLFARHNGEEFLISIEAKSDESFGEQTFEEAFEEGLNLLKPKPESGKFDRAVKLYTRFGMKKSLLKMRYQLLHWLAGTIEEAKRQEIANVILISQEFHSSITKDKKIQQNFSDFNSFIFAISDGQLMLENQKKELIGEISSPDYFRDGRIWLGRYVVDL
ncbi:MAG: DUF6946 family protein [bacterium]